MSRKSLSPWRMLVLLITISLPAFGQDAPTTGPPAVTAEMVQSRITAIKAAVNLPQSDQILNVYEQALGQIKESSQLESQLQVWNQKRQQIPDALAKAEQTLAVQPSAELPKDTDKLSLSDVESRVGELQTKVDELRHRLQKLRSTPKDRDVRQTEIQKSLTQVEADSPASLQVGDDAPQPFVEAARITKLVRSKFASVATEVLNAEHAYYQQSRELVTKQTKAVETELHVATEALVAWRKVADQRRNEQARREVKKKQSTQEVVGEDLRPLAEQNTLLAKRLPTLIRQINQSNRELEGVKQQTDLITQQFQSVRVFAEDQSNITDSIGQLLLEIRGQLPDANPMREQIDTRRRTIQELRASQLEVEDGSTQLADTEDSARNSAEQIANAGGDPTGLDDDIKKLLNERKQTFDKLQQHYQTYIKNLIDLNLNQEALVKSIDEFKKFIDDRILWTRSVPPLQLKDVLHVSHAFVWAFDGQSWRDVWELVRSRTPILHLIVGVFVVAYFVFVGIRGKRRITELGVVAKSQSCREIELTLRTLFLTLFVSVRGPAILLFAAWVFTENSASVEAVPLAASLSAASWAAAWTMWPLTFWLLAMVPNGLALAHFDWSEHTVRRMRRHLFGLLYVVIPATAVYYLFHATNLVEWERSTVRFALLAAVGAATVFLFRAFSPREGLPHRYLAEHQDTWVFRLQHVWYGAIVAIPITVGVLAIFGYQYTAGQLVRCVYLTAVLLGGLCVVEAVALRWLLMNRRVLAIAQAQERLAVAAADQTQDEDSNVPFVEPQVDLSVINDQTRRLLTSLVFAAAAIGVYWIWLGVLPALSRINDVPLWQASDVQAIASPAEGHDVTSGVSHLRTSGGWITLGNLLASILILICMWVAVGNIPGLLEIAVLQHLPMDTALRFAITTVTRYVLVIVGVGWAFSNIGVGWSKIQWLAAAVSVGLGFGMQEIFANFVSGLILLFERPLRAGDTVTVGDVTGTVVEIKTRATTIQDYDRKELVVPNKEFITGKLLNWTLTDEINRIVICIGVAYGSDIRQCRNLVLKAASDHPRILDGPNPSVTFDAFGDNALNLTLRCYLANLTDRLSVVHELHASIYDNLNAAGISIPFPQRDVHIIQENA